MKRDHRFEGELKIGTKCLDCGRYATLLDMVYHPGVGLRSKIGWNQTCPGPADTSEARAIIHDWISKYEWEK